MTFTPIAFFIMVGVANWTAHVLQCPSCRTVLNYNVTFVLEGFNYVFGWPVHLCAHFMEWAKRPVKGLTEEEVSERVKAVVGEMLGGSGAQTFVLEQLEGESFEDFKVRAEKVTREHLSNLTDRTKS